MRRRCRPGKKERHEEDEVVTVGTVFILDYSASRQERHTLDGTLVTTPWALWHVEAREGWPGVVVSQTAQQRATDVHWATRMWRRGGGGEEERRSCRAKEVRGGEERTGGAGWPAS
jgi:hypothetical protein